MKSTERKRAKKKLDKVFSKYIRLRDNYTCIVCGLRDERKAQCGHLFSRISTSTRWDLLNAACQCAGCNYRHEFDFEPYRRKFVALHGEKAYNDLYQKFKSTVKYNVKDLKEMIVKFEKMIEDLTKENNKI